jgi:hypothetical protein
MILAFMPQRALRIAASCAVALCLAGPALAADAPAAAFADAELLVEGMTYVAGEGPRNEVLVEAGRARVGRGEQIARLESVHVRVGAYASESSASRGGLELECQRGSFDLARGDLAAEGRVRGRTADGRRFETESLVYQRATGRVTTRSPVVIHDAFGTLRGAGFEYWVRENRFRLIGGASVETSP